jgi:hypothetical protein
VGARLVDRSCAEAGALRLVRDLMSVSGMIEVEPRRLSIERIVLRR